MFNQWGKKDLGQLIRIASGQVDPKNEDISKLLSVGPENLKSGGGLDLGTLKSAGELGQISGKYAFDETAILYSKIRPNLNKAALPDFRGICSADMYPMWIRDARSADRRFIYYVLTSERFVADATSRSFRTGLPKINRPDLESIEVALPPISEQLKIAEILCAWDEAIKKLATLCTAKERRLDGLRSQLLFNSTRLEWSRTGWLFRNLSEVTYELSERNAGMALGRNLVMGVTNTRGIVPMREQTIAEDISRYKCLPPRAFAYNPMRINVGSIAMNEGDRTVLVSPDYVVFACRDTGLHPDYFNHLRETQWWAHHIDSGGSGSVRKRTYYDDLGALRLPLPNFGEQQKIVRILNTAKADVVATEKMVDALTRQKHGLMQKLMTGEWRVKDAGKEAAA